MPTPLDMNNYSPLLRRLQAGISMIEVLVSLTIVAFGVLGLLGLQARAMSFQRDSFDRRTAAEMVAQLGERIRANHTGLTDGSYGGLAHDWSSLTPTSITPCQNVANCQAAELAQRDWDQWIIEYRRRSPGSTAYTQWDGVNDPRSILLSVGWSEPQSNPTLSTAGIDPICDAINNQVGASIPLTYRCYQTAIFP